MKKSAMYKKMGWDLIVYPNFSEEKVCIVNNRFELTYESYLPIVILYLFLL